MTSRERERESAVLCVLYAELHETDYMHEVITTN